jgi:hypothetical protein
MTHGWLGLDWGNVPAWFGAVVTSGSAAVAALAYRRSVRDKEAQQASLVGAWIDWSKSEEGGEAQLQVSNGSDGSVFEVTLRHRTQWTRFPEKPIPELPGKANRTFDIGVPGQVRPGEPVPREGLPVVQPRVVYLLEEPSGVELEFRDSLGYRWKRDELGRLSRIPRRTVAYNQPAPGYKLPT